MIHLEFIIPVVLFISIAWLVNNIVSRRSLNRERMSMIEKGGDPGILNDVLPKKGFFDSNTLKYGLVAIGVSLGCLLGSYFEQNQVLANTEVGYFFGIFLFTGLALVTSYYLNKKENK